MEENTLGYFWESIKDVSKIPLNIPLAISVLHIRHVSRNAADERFSVILTPPCDFRSLKCHHSLSAILTNPTYPDSLCFQLKDPSNFHFLLTRTFKRMGIPDLCAVRYPLCSTITNTQRGKLTRIEPLRTSTIRLQDPALTALTPTTTKQYSILTTPPQSTNSNILH
jgi:hypothetical protein